MDELGIIKKEFCDYLEESKKAIGPTSSTRNNPVFTSLAHPLKRKEVNEKWMNLLTTISEGYSNSKSLSEYKQDIEFLQEEMEKAFPGTVTFRISHAQKSLSVHLKYLWCKDPNRPAPPACPIDSMVLCRLGWPYCREHWTRMEKKKLFEILDELNKRAGGDDKIALMELRWFYEMKEFNKQYNSSYV